MNYGNDLHYQTIHAIWFYSFFHAHIAIDFEPTKIIQFADLSDICKVLLSIRWTCKFKIKLNNGKKPDKSDHR
jgi:hypothetical protein